MARNKKGWFSKPLSCSVAAVLGSVAFLTCSSLAYADEVHAVRKGAEHAHETEAHGLEEPLFTKRSFPEKEIEFESEFEDADNEEEVEIAAGVSWAFFDRLQLGVEIPLGIRDPDDGDKEHDLGDIEFSTKYTFYRAPEDRLVLSVDGDVAVPSGEEDEEIGGAGEWGVFLTAGSAVPLGAGIPDLGVHLQAGWEQEIDVTDEKEAEAAELGVASEVEKEAIWRLAFNMPLFDGRFIPIFEVLGETIVDAIEEEEEGTIVELGGGFWWHPFFRHATLHPFLLGAAAKGPVTERDENNFTALLVLKWEFE